MKDVIDEVIAEDAALCDRREVVTAAPVATYDELRRQLADVSNGRDEALRKFKIEETIANGWQARAVASEARNAELLSAMSLMAENSDDCDVVEICRAHIAQSPSAAGGESVSRVIPLSGCKFT